MVATSAMRMRAALVVCAVTFCFAADAAWAEVVEVVPGIRVTKKTYNAPLNEQPFFGFVPRSPAMQDADAKFLAALTSAVGSKEKAFDETLRRGWAAFFGRDLPTAGRRFNQAYLIDPGQSGVFHSFAVIAHARFNDPEYAEELFRVAKSRPKPMVTLNADYGRLLLIMKRPRDAQPLLEQAVLDAPDFATAWSNLAAARYHNGDHAGACTAVAEAARRPGAPAVQSDLEALRALAKCVG